MARDAGGRESLRGGLSDLLASQDYSSSPSRSPVSTPCRPWSHISLDFVIGLLVSKSLSVVLTVVDRFSKIVHFVGLANLSSAVETA